MRPRLERLLAIFDTVCMYLTTYSRYLEQPTPYITAPLPVIKKKALETADDRDLLADLEHSWPR